MAPPTIIARPFNKKVYLTEGGYQKLQSELDFLRTVKRREIAEYLHSVVDGEDLQENNEYQLAKDEQALVESRIQYLEFLLNRAEIIQPSGSTGEVRIGCRVTIQEESGLFETYTIVGCTEADARLSLISDESPMGQALMGRRVGESVQVAAPDGKYEIRIISIT